MAPFLSETPSCCQTQSQRHPFWSRDTSVPVEKHIVQGTRSGLQELRVVSSKDNKKSRAFIPIDTQEEFFPTWKEFSNTVSRCELSSADTLDHSLAGSSVLPRVFAVISNIYIAAQWTIVSSLTIFCFVTFKRFVLNDEIVGMYIFLCVNAHIPGEAIESVRFLGAGF